MKKYIIISTILLVSIFSLSSCLFQEEDVFDKPAAERMSEATSELKNLLMSANGWQVTYFTDTLYFGAYNMIMKFDENKVHIQGDNVFEPGVHSGYYGFNNSQGVVLAFTTYNEVLGYLADPSQYYIGLGLGGDNEFIWEKGSTSSQDTIYFRAKKNGNKVKFIRYDGNWDDYFNRVEDIYQKFNAENMDKYFKMIRFNDGSEVVFCGYDEVYRTFNPTYTVNNGDSVVTLQNGIAFTETGIEFYNAVKYENKVFKDLIYKDGKFVTTASDGVEGELIPVEQPPFILPGNMHENLFNGRTYRLTGLSKKYNELYSEMAKQVPSFERVAFIGDKNNNGVYYMAIIVQLGQELKTAYLVEFNFKNNIDNRNDKFTLATPANIRVGIGGGLTDEEAEIYNNAGANFIGPCNDFIKAFIPTGTVHPITGAITGGEKYIVIPDGLFRNFILGSTVSNKYFRLSNW